MCPSMSIKMAFFDPPELRRIPLKSPVVRRWALVLAGLTTYAQNPKVMDMDIDFFDHNHWLPAPSPTLTEAHFQGPAAASKHKKSL